MCLTELFKDIQTAINNPPRGALDREILYSRLKAYWVRVQYCIWNILATTLLYVFTDSMLWLSICEKQYYYNIIFHSFQSMAIIAYFIASLRNPGYILPTKLDMFQSDSIDIDIIDIDESENDNKIENENDYKYLDVNINYILNNSSHHRNTKLMVDDEEEDAEYPYDIVQYVPEYNRAITIDPVNAPSQFCWRCKFIRPIRSKHCYDCDRCVIRFDHHCPMIGNCVGSNNHRFFVLFMSTQTIVVLWTFYLSLNTLFQMNYNGETTHIERGAFGWICRIIFFMVLFFAVFVTVGLCGYHIYLGCTNQTTYEMIKPQIIERYIKDETKRKTKYIKRQKRQLKKHDIDNKNDEKQRQDDDESDISVSSASDRLLQKTPKLNKKKKRKNWYNYTDEYRNYFDEGFLGNMWIFLSGKVYPEWRTPLPCIVFKKSKNK